LFVNSHAGKRDFLLDGNISRTPQALQGIKKEPILGLYTSEDDPSVEYAGNHQINWLNGVVSYYGEEARTH
jgi:hypothetical protein